MFWEARNVSQPWTEILGDADHEGSREIIGTTVGDDQQINAMRIVSAVNNAASVADQLEAWAEGSEQRFTATGEDAHKNRAENYRRLAEMLRPE